MEAFCAEHNESIECVLYEWPGSKFEGLYSAFAKRKVAEQLSQRRALEMAALWGNTNLDNEKEPQLRQKWMENLDNAFSTAIKNLYEPESAEANQDYDENDPFYQAMEKGIEKYHELPEEPTVDQVL